MGEVRCELRRTFAAPRPLVWAIVSDTNRFDRAAGLAAGRYTWVRDGVKNLRSAVAREIFGVEVEWIEPPYGWIEGRYVSGERRFVRGPARGGTFLVRLRDVDGGTEAHAIATVDAPFPIDWIQKLKLSRGLAAYFAGIEAVLGQSKGALAASSDGDEPAMARAKRLLAQGYDPTMSGPVSEVDADSLATRAERLRATGIDAALVDKLVEWLRSRPDDEVAQIRPFELARLWGAERRDVLGLFLRATEAGLVDLSWQILCPVCRVGASVVGSLADIEGGNAHCGACEIDYAVDFAKHVEAVFPCNAAVRKVSQSMYCASSPAFLPHVHSQIRLAAGETREEDADFPRGQLHIRTLWTKHATDVTLEHAPARLVITIRDDGVDARAEGDVDGGAGAATKLVVANESGDEATVLVERRGWSADAVLGCAIASMPDFLRLFATEAPASGVELTVSHLALLFSDLTGSTALYESVGDARAFAFVEDHFRIMTEAIENAGGALVKTMGDAVMAAFPSAAEATRAGLAMIAKHDAECGVKGLGVKIGIHAGPCLAVRANERLDYFGTTVNVAARLQAQAHSSQIVMTEELAREVRALVEGLPRKPFEADLKGIEQRQKLVAFEVGRGSRPPARAASDAP